MEATELPPFDCQLMKDRATKESPTGAGELLGYGIIAWQRLFWTVRRPDFLRSCASTKPDADFLLDVLDRTFSAVRNNSSATSPLKNSATTHAQPGVDAIHGRGGVRIAIG
jgi:hypothetical protein